MKIQRMSKSIMPLSAMMLLLVVTVGSASTYTYDVSEVQLWTDESTTTSNVDNVQVRAYVPGSNSITYRTMPIYSSTTRSGANSFGDVVGYTNNIYGTSPAFVDPYDGAQYSLNYPTYQLMKTRMYSVNDQRLALGDYMQTGAVVHQFIYDLIYKKYTTLSELNSKLGSSWTQLSDMNNHGQVVGTALEGGFAYDCQNGQSTINVEGSAWTKPQKIDDDGNVYGTFSHPDMPETYFVATPDTSAANITCSLIRDDVFGPIVFGSGLSFEMSGDSANAISAADFSGDGTTDILVDHGGKVILYLGEEDFDKKIKYYGESFSAIFGNEFPDVVVPADVTDVDNDGFDDSIIVDGSKTQLSLGKADGSFYYVPQVLNDVSKFADMNNDGFSDIITVNGAFISVEYQQPMFDTTPADTTPVDATPVDATPVDTTPIDTTPVDTTAPVVTLLGSSPIDVELNSVYIDAGAIAFDDTDGSIPETSIVTVNPVNTAVLGTYTVIYDVSDSSGNEATLVTRTVNVVDTTPVDTTAPVITLLGSSPIDVEIDSVYTDAGVTASDDTDGNIPATSIVTVNPVNTAVLGTYTVIYDVSDSSGNEAALVTRTVNVVDTTPVDTTDGIPAISPDAESVEFEGQITSIGTSNYVINGKTVWITTDTIFKVNDDVPIDIGLNAQVKGMQNPDGEVVGIKVELN